MADTPQKRNFSIFNTASCSREKFCVGNFFFLVRGSSCSFWDCSIFYFESINDFFESLGGCGGDVTWSWFEKFEIFY